MHPKDKANKHLSSIRQLRQEQAELEARCKAEIAKIHDRYHGEFAELTTALASEQTELTLLMKSETADIFEGLDKVLLDDGILFHTKERKVSIPRNALEKIESEGWIEAVKVVKSVNREVVQKWPEERLIIIGAKRKVVNTYSYEVKELE